VDGTSFFKKMRKSLGNKRNEVCDAQRDDITRLYGRLADGDHAPIFDNAGFGHEINFNRYFCKYAPPRPLDEIEADLKKIQGEIADMLAEVTE
jgi:type I restriction enzyme M protein